MSKQRLSRFILLGSLLIVSISQAAKPLSFTLERLDNEKAVTVTEKDWIDKYLLVAIGYTGCPDICPTTMLDLRQMLETLDSVASKQGKLIQPLFITIDPQSDTLVDITQFAAFFDSRIIGLRAKDYKQLNQVVKQLRATYGYRFDGKPVYPPNLPTGYTVMHSTFIYLYSPDRRLLDAFPYNVAGEVLAKRILTYLP